MRSWLFWLAFTVAGVWAQHFAPGLDFLAAGLIVSLQEQRPGRTLWLALAWVLVQEGMGSLAFGTVILLYASLGIMYAVGRWLFEAKNLLFVCLLGVGYALVMAGLNLTMATLQDAVAPVERLLRLGFMQAVLTPVEWLVLSRLFAKYGEKRSARTVPI
ncbi:hypothetical protein [Desulfohalovibrio reitneri]|uniref:hypothetical protein n=1 Tax=Desulfohalovibrio reitneri TaxID=1307759 RepID=UPI0004A6BFF5|nr:hypothetical protein [Desulfohalovibrio reitneri]